MPDIWSFTLSQDLESICELLNDGVKVDSRNSLGETPLHLAAGRGLERVAKALLDAGADVHLSDWESGWSPLHRSLYFGHIRLSLLLLQAGAALDGDQDQSAYRAGSSKKPRSLSRSESLGAFCPNPDSARSTTARRRSDRLGDDDGNSPLDLVSLELRPQLKAARDKALGGDVYSFGKADFFLGCDTFGKADVISPRRVEALANLRVVRLAASRYHSAAVTLCGKLFTWGHGRSGRLGHGQEEVCMLPTLVAGLVNQMVVDVAASETHTAALTADGELYTWGRDRFGQLGHGSGSTGRLAPKRVEGLRKMRVVGVATGTEHTAVVTISGVCYTWGRNNHGQLGVAGASQTSAPRAVSYLASGASRGAGGVGRHVIKVSASARSTVVVTLGVSRGSGLHPVNEVHQWGHGSHVPSRVTFNASNNGGSSSRWQTHDARVNITDVAAAKCHNLALSSVGQVFTWGFGADNLGLDPRETRTARGPKLVTAMLPENCGGNAVHVSASDQHSCVVTDTGDLFTWGTAGEDGGALGLGDKRWQPVAKRVPSLKKVVSVAAAPDHTVVLLQAYCPPLPHDASVTNARGQPGLESCRARALGPEAASEQEGDVDSDFGDGAEDEKESPRDDHPETGVGAACFNDANEVLAPLSLKQHCEIVLAREVDLRNAASLLAYADALDAPALVEYCARFVSANLDGILVLGRESDRCCLLETSGALARSLLCGRDTRARRAVPFVTEPGSPDAEAMSEFPEGEEGLDRVAMATALARAEMRAGTPSIKAASRAVRSLKKKIARIVELKGLRDSGKDLSADQLWRVEQKSRMEAELSSLDSQLERAKITEAVRDRRLQTEGRIYPAASANSNTPDVKRSLSLDEGCTDAHGHPAVGLDSDGNSAKKDLRWSPQLDLSQDEIKANTKRPIKCEACRVECANANMYADHLRGKKHRATTAKLEQQLHDAAKASQLQDGGSLTWAHVSLQEPPTAASAAARASPTAKPAACSIPAASCEATRRGHVSCTDATNGPRDGRLSHLVSRRVELGTMRQPLEQQHKAGTMWMKSTGKDPAAVTTGHGMTSLRPNTPSSSICESSQPVAYSLVDFIAPGSKKVSGRKGNSNDEKQVQVARVWGTEGERSPEIAISAAGGQGVESKPDTAGGVDGQLKKKSFHEIIEEEERDKKERDEYGNSVWFVSQKPRSTSFEGIVKQQRREEQVAEEEKAREIEDEMDQEMLRFVLEMSKCETKGDGCSEGKAGNTKQRSSERGGRTAGRASRHRKDATRPQINSKEGAEANTGARVAKTPRKQTTSGAKSGSGPRRSHSSRDGEPVQVPSSSGQSRRSKRGNRSGTVGDQAGNQERNEGV